jgi:hypothetical protein
MTASYRRAANDVGEGTDFRLVSLRIVPGHIGTNSPAFHGLSSAQRWGRFFGRMMPSPNGRVAARAMPLADPPS